MVSVQVSDTLLPHGSPDPWGIFIPVRERCIPIIAASRRLPATCGTVVRRRPPLEAPGLVSVEIPAQRKSHLAGCDRQTDDPSLCSWLEFSAFMTTDELQPSTSKAFTDVARTMILELSVLVK